MLFLGKRFSIPCSCVELSGQRELRQRKGFFLKKKKITVYNGHSANCLKGFALVCNEREACNRAVTEYKKEKYVEGQEIITSNS